MRAGEKAPIPTRERRRENSSTSPWQRNVPSEGSEPQVLHHADDDDDDDEVLNMQREPITDRVEGKPTKAKPLFGQPGESRTVWVGKLSEECTEGDLRKLLSAAGPVCRVNLLSATRCAFVEFGDPDSAEAAVRAFSGRRFFGKIIRLNLACDLVSTSSKVKNGSNERRTSENVGEPKTPLDNIESKEQQNDDQQVPNDPPPAPEQQGDANGSVDDDGRDYKALWLGSLDDPTLSEADILRIFQKYRPISANVITKTSCGFVNFRTENDAAEARRELNGFVIAGNSKRPMRIEFKVIGGFSTGSPKSSPQHQSEPAKAKMNNKSQGKNGNKR